MSLVHQFLLQSSVIFFNITNTFYLLVTKSFLLNMFKIEFQITFLAAVYSSRTMFNIRLIILPTINCNGNADVIRNPYSLNWFSNSLTRIKKKKLRAYINKDNNVDKMLNNFFFIFYLFKQKVHKKMIYHI